MVRQTFIAVWKDRRAIVYNRFPIKYEAECQLSVKSLSSVGYVKELEKIPLMATVRIS